MAEFLDEDEPLPEDIEKLLEALSSDFLVYTREKAAKKLGELTTSNNRIVDALMAASRDEDSRVRRAAVEALHALPHQVILERRGFEVEAFWRYVYPPKYCARCKVENPYEQVNCTKCGFPLNIKPTTKWVPAIWMDVLESLLWEEMSSPEILFTSLTLEPAPLTQTILALLGAVCLPFFFLLLLFGPEGLLSPFSWSLASTFLSFFLIAGVTYGYARLLGAHERFSTHTYLLSLVYAPLTLISLVLELLLLLLFIKESSSCLYILQVGLGILLLILIVRVLYYGQQLSKWRAIFVTGMSIVTIIFIGICMGLSLVIWSKTIGPPFDTLITQAQEEQTQELSPKSQRATATRQARVERNATATARQVTVEAHTIGRTFPRQQDLQSVSFSPDGQEFVSVGQTVVIWDIVTLKEKAHLSGHQALVTGVSYSPDGRKLATADERGVVKIWDTQTWQALSTISGIERVYNKVTFSPNGQKIVVKGGGRFIVIDMNTGQPVYTVETPSNLINITYSPDGRYIMAVKKGYESKDGVQVWDAQTGQEVTSFGWDKANSIISAKYSPDGRHLLIGKLRGMVEIWDIKTGELVLTFQTQRLLDYAGYSPDGRNVITGGERSAKVWQAATGQEIVTLAHQDDVWLALYSPDGQYIITVTEDDIPVIWETRLLREGGNFFVGPLP